MVLNKMDRIEFLLGFRMLVFPIEFDIKKSRINDVFFNIRYFYSRFSVKASKFAHTDSCT